MHARKNVISLSLDQILNLKNENTPIHALVFPRVGSPASESEPLPDPTELLSDVRCFGLGERRCFSPELWRRGRDLRQHQHSSIM